MTRKVSVLAAAIEVATGTALLLVPSLVGHLLFGAELTGVAVVLARLAGIALMGLSIACWPGTPLAGLLTYLLMTALLTLAATRRAETNE